jgi:hypothetical protein
MRPLRRYCSVMRHTAIQGWLYNYPAHLCYKETTRLPIVSKLFQGLAISMASHEAYRFIRSQSNYCWPRQCNDTEVRIYYYYYLPWSFRTHLRNWMGSEWRVRHSSVTCMYSGVGGGYGRRACNDQGALGILSGTVLGPVAVMNDFLCS